CARDTGISSSKRTSYQRWNPYRRRRSANRPPSLKLRRISVAPSAAAIRSRSGLPEAASPLVKTPVLKGAAPSCNLIRTHPSITAGPPTSVSGLFPVTPSERGSGSRVHESAAHITAMHKIEYLYFIQL